MIDPAPYGNKRGFTLVEIMVALAVAGVVIAGLWQVYRAQTQAAVSQEQVTTLQQNLRVAVLQMKRDLRMAGFNPSGRGNFGLTFIGFYNLNGVPDLNGQSAISFTADNSDDPLLLGNGTIDTGETITYSIYDAPVGFPDTFRDLARNDGSGRDLAAENIANLGLAYAFDNDGDGLLDTYTAGGSQAVFWAIDSNNDGLLDQHLDTNGDGVIDRLDGPTGTGPENIVGAPLAATVPMDRIRAVRIWLLAEARHNDESWYDNDTYVVGRQIITPQDNRRRRLFETIIQLKNMGLN
jgi:type IV pilus assembly protein PilW